MITRFDEVILTKASKIKVEDVMKEIEELQIKFCDLEEYRTNDLQAKSKLHIEIQTLNKDFRNIEQHLETVVNSAVRKETFKLRSEFTAELFKGNIRREEVEELIENKIDRVEYLSTLDLKSNKSDLKENMQCIDIMHKQIKSIIALFTELSFQFLSDTMSSQESVKSIKDK